MIKRVRDQLEAQGLGLELTQAAKYYVVDKGCDSTLGARPLRRALQRYVEDPLSEKILWEGFRAGETIIVDVEQDAEVGEPVVVFRSIEGIEPPPVALAGAGSGE